MKKKKVPTRCAACSGRGYVAASAIGWEPCARCHGMGSVGWVLLDVPETLTTKRPSV